MGFYSFRAMWDKQATEKERHLLAAAAWNFLPTRPEWERGALTLAYPIYESQKINYEGILTVLVLSTL